MTSPQQRGHGRKLEAERLSQRKAMLKTMADSLSDKAGFEVFQRRTAIITGQNRMAAISSASQAEPSKAERPGRRAVIKDSIDLVVVI